MKRRDLIDKLQAAGWQIIHGNKHDLAVHPKLSGKIPIPRHNIINEYTAKNILKAAGLI